MARSCALLSPLHLSKITQGIGKARQDDTGKLKSSIVGYLPFDTTKDILDPPIAPNAKFKTDRGFSHPLTGRLLIPYSQIEEYANAAKFVHIFAISLIVGLTTPQQGGIRCPFGGSCDGWRLASLHV
jgi:hypothetical protein